MVLLAGILLPLVASATPMVGVETIHNDAAPVLSSMDAKIIPDSYVVKFKDHVSQNSADKHHGWVRNVHQASERMRKRSQIPMMGSFYSGLKHTYNIGNELRGYAGHFDAETLEQIRRHPDVDYIERDIEMHIQSKDEPKTEKGAPWGLARISHRKGLSFGTFNKYLYSADGGEGVDVYVIDTGTSVKHLDFEGRAHWGKTIPQNDVDQDGNGHGTHCSGTVAGKKYGVAKKANVYAVKVLGSGGSGTMSDVVKGVEWAVSAHLKQVKAAKAGKRKGFKGSAANMSLGGGKSTLLERAVNAAVDNGMNFAVAAGNDNQNSCNYSPAAAEKAVTVGATDFSDSRAFFSNYGKCNDIFAPGVNIESTWIGSTTAINTISGTSMASPHIAGLLAYFLSLQPASDSAYATESLSPAKLKKHLIAIGTRHAISDVPSDTTNVLAWNGGGISNFSEIVSQGGYDASTSSPTTPPVELPSFDDMAEGVERITITFGDKVESGIEAAEAKLERLEEKLMDVTEEIKELIEEYEF